MSEDMPLGWGYAPQAVAFEPADADAEAPNAADKSRAMRIAYWLGTQRVVPTSRQIMARWQVARVTASRWRAFALKQARIYNGEEA